MFQKENWVTFYVRSYLHKTLMIRITNTFSCSLVQKLLIEVSSKSFEHPQTSLQLSSHSSSKTPSNLFHNFIHKSSRISSRPLAKSLFRRTVRGSFFSFNCCPASQNTEQLEKLETISSRLLRVH